MLGEPSLPSRALPLPAGLLPASSAVRLGDSGPANLCLCIPCNGSGFFDGAVELADESDVCDSTPMSDDRFEAGWRLAIFLGSPRNVALMS